MSFLPYGRQTISDEDIAAVADALRSDYLTTGPLVDQFEQAFAAASGAAYAVACNSGTAALHLAAAAAGIGPGQTAIVPAITFVATANVVRLLGGDVCFADVDADTGLMTPETLSAALDRAARMGRKVTAALPVHLNGQLCDMAGLSVVAKAHGLIVIEDACHALGVTDVGRCDYSSFACFSTHPVKAIATGEGGVVTTNDAERAWQLKSFRSHGLIRDAARCVDPVLSLDGNGQMLAWAYEMQEPGWNYRMPDILCALGISQLQRLQSFLARRRELVDVYDEAFAPLAPLVRPVPHDRDGHGWHLYALLMDFASIGLTRSQVMASLREAGIGTQVHYIPVNRQPYYRAHDPVELPGANAYYDRCISIPFYPLLSNSDALRVAREISKLVGA